MVTISVPIANILVDPRADVYFINEKLTWLREFDKVNVTVVSKPCVIPETIKNVKKHNPENNAIRIEIFLYSCIFPVKLLSCEDGLLLILTI